jgi:hypothetical protein
VETIAGNISPKSVAASGAGHLWVACYSGTIMVFGDR